MQGAEARCRLRSANGAAERAWTATIAVKIVAYVPTLKTTLIANAVAEGESSHNAWPAPSGATATQFPVVNKWHGTSQSGTSFQKMEIDVNELTDRMKELREEILSERKWAIEGFAKHLTEAIRKVLDEAPYIYRRDDANGSLKAYICAVVEETLLEELTELKP